ncbi:hypothetical protein M2480_000001 [Parabacteroides sp. PFB2-12]|uniref:hypothetical protein n=1 Tax=unclassified Parabacteroides TaxID=2649774 RepID=UPI002473C0FD|nr:MULTISPECIES: hypothetical protein [unclassified Parabacteroides]MDH6341251.1 hypothetical protein [Parabacteroides sp. PM6-13]MDH6389043.1 hypothetical protein [Parabacteroides sp. PFB2-12]
MLLLRVILKTPTFSEKYSRDFDKMTNWESSDFGILGGRRRREKGERRKEKGVSSNIVKIEDLKELGYIFMAEGHSGPGRPSPSGTKT